MFILDTDHTSLLEWASGEGYQQLNARLEQVGTEEITTTIVTYEEQTRGWLRYVRKARKVAQMVDAYRKLSRHLDTYRPLRVLEFDERAAVEFQRLQKLRLRSIGPMDLKIAAIALCHDATLLSSNLAHFHLVPGLKVEDWTV